MSLTVFGVAQMVWVIAGGIAMAIVGAIACYALMCIAGNIIEAILRPVFYPFGLLFNFLDGSVAERAALRAQMQFVSDQVPEPNIALDRVLIWSLFALIAVPALAYLITHG